MLEGKDDALQAQRAAEEEAREKRTDLQRQERLLLDRSESLDHKLEALERREAGFEERQREVEEEKVRLVALQQRQIAELERVSGLTAGEARQALIQQIVDEAQAEAQHRVREIERHAADEGDERARRILTTVMQRIAADHTSEATVTVVLTPVRGDEGPHHRPRGPQHPRPRAGDRRRPDHRRHARRRWSCPASTRCAARWRAWRSPSSSATAASTPDAIEETVAKCRAEIEVRHAPGAASRPPTTPACRACTRS